MATEFALETRGRRRYKTAVNGPGRGVDRDVVFRPTLRRAWPREDPRPPCAFETSMLGVFCNSHEVTRLAALFIDARAE